MSKRKWIKPGPMTGYPPGLLQDDDPQLSKWFASRPDARRVVRSVCKEIEDERLHHVRAHTAHRGSGSTHCAHA
jgi:hypothetical protein